MKNTFLILCIVAIAISCTSARLTIRHRRQVEREDPTSGSSSSSELPASEVVVIKDTVNPSLPGPLFLVPRLPGPGDAFDLDINEQDGTFVFGGQLPSHFHHHHHNNNNNMGQMGHQSFAGLFDAIQRRFDEMTRNMMSFNNFGPGFSPTTDISSLPDDYNKTDSEIVELNGHRYVKKTTTLKKGGPGATFFVRSTTFEKVNEDDNTPGAEEVETDKKDKPSVIGGGPEDGIESEGPKVEESVPVPSNTSDEPKIPDEASSTPAQPSSTSTSTSTEAPVAESSPDVPAGSPDDAAAAEDAKDKGPNNESNETDDQREREGESLPSSSSSTTEQP